MHQLRATTATVHHAAADTTFGSYQAFPPSWTTFQRQKTESFSLKIE